MFNYLKSGFRDLRSLVSYIRMASTNALIRLFNSRKQRYDDLIQRMDQFRNVMEATAATDDVNEIDVSGGNTRKRASRSKIRTNTQTVRFNDGVALPIQEFNAPNRKKLAQNVQLFDEANEHLREFEEMIKRLKRKRDVASKKIVAEMTEYYNTIYAKREELYDILEGLTDKHAPKEVMELASDMMEHINNVVSADSYDELAWDMNVSSHNSLTGGDKEPIEFTYYLYIDGLNKDMFDSDQLILVLTSIVHETKGRKIQYDTFDPDAEENDEQPDVSKTAQKQQQRKSNASRRNAPAAYFMSFHLTSISSFQAPGSFDIGKRLSGNDLRGVSAALKREMTKLISLHSVMPMVGKRKLGNSRQKILHSGILDIEGVTNVEVEDDDVLISISDMDDAFIREELWPELVVYLRRTLRIPRRSSFVYNIEQSDESKVLRVSNVNDPELST